MTGLLTCAREGCQNQFAQIVAGNRKWCSERCRVLQYGTPCIDCGEPASIHCERCLKCAKAQKVQWPAEAILTAIREWAEKHGHRPKSTEWQTTGGRPGVGGGDHPATSIVVLRFGSWGAAITAAGFTPDRRGSRKALTVACPFCDAEIGASCSRDDGRRGCHDERKAMVA